MGTPCDELISLNWSTNFFTMTPSKENALIADDVTVFSSVFKNLLIILPCSKNVEKKIQP